MVDVDIPGDGALDDIFLLDFALDLDRRGARLGELPGHPPDLHHRLLAGESQDDRHLQQHAESVADVVGVEFLEAFGAIPALQQERIIKYTTRFQLSVYDAAQLTDEKDLSDFFESILIHMKPLVSILVWMRNRPFCSFSALGMSLNPVALASLPFNP